MSTGRPSGHARLETLEAARGSLIGDALDEARALLDDLRPGDDPTFARVALAVGRRWPDPAAPERLVLLREGFRRASGPLADQLCLQLVDAHSLSGDLSEAARLLDGLAPGALSPESANVFALQLRRLGRFDEAEAAWLALLGRGDGVTPRLRGLCWSYVAHLRMSAGRLDEVAGALAAADAVGAPDEDVRLHLATTRFDLAMRLRDLDAAADALERAPRARDPAHVELMAANAACLAALRGRWDADAFRGLVTHSRADLRLLGATGLMGACADDEAAAVQALDSAERAWTASPAAGPELAWLAERAAERWEAARFPRRDCARARRWSARASREVDPAQAAVERARLAALGVPLVGPFQIELPLGRGGGGTVFRALHVSGVPAAVKVLHDPTDQARDLLENELRAVAALDHPCIASLFDTGLVDDVEAATHPDLAAGTRWVASELIGGGELTALCGRIEWERARSLLLGVLDALAHAHARGLLHLDLKPSNVLLHPSGAPVLVDFGLARGIGSARPRSLSGTPQYMAPESFDRGGPGVGPPTDLYALGCLVYELVCGEPPFGADLQELRRGRRVLPPLRPRVDVPPGLEAWLRTAVAPDPGARFPTAASAAQALLQLGPARPTPIHAGPVRASEAPTVLIAAGPSPERPGAAAATGSPPPVPPIPPVWTRTERRLRPEVAVASLGLFRFRRFPLVGRRAERSLLWSCLRRAEAGERSLVAVTGEAGSGRRALVRWLVERSREVGAERVPITVLHEPSLPELRAATGALVLVTAERWPDDWPDPIEIGLRPLSPAELREILDRALHLADDLADALVTRAEGLPGRLLGSLVRLVELDRLVDGPDGHQLRRGASLD